jgi:hypothetical protein
LLLAVEIVRGPLLHDSFKQQVLAVDAAAAAAHQH